MSQIVNIIIKFTDETSAVLCGTETRRLTGRGKTILNVLKVDVVKRPCRT